PKVRSSGGPRPETDLWRAPTAEQGDVPSVLYRASSRRALSEDLRADLAICILEAAARRKTPLPVPLQDGLADPDRLVRWTAERLLSELAKDAG
ncbi:MAG: hypothetical protein QGG40_22615, partial [Myxococcota bacterium]|nr:hypothetical protein [Myxococcota bacterium]